MSATSRRKKKRAARKRKKMIVDGIVGPVVPTGGPRRYSTYPTTVMAVQIAKEQKKHDLQNFRRQLRAVDDEMFEERFLTYLDQLAQLSPITSRSTKRVVRAATAHPDLEGHLRYELHNITRAFASDDGREARQAFLDKRDPAFEGR